jgi:GAF domain-containing protein
LALENARLLEEAQRRTTPLRLLQEVTAAASAHTAVEDLLDNVAQTLREGLDLDFVGATIFSYRIPGFSATRERFGTPKDQDPRYDHLQTIIWDVRAIPAVRALVESGRSELLQVEGGARQLSSAAYLLEQVGIVSVLLQPILYRGQVIGLLDLHTSLPQNIFGAENRNLMDQVTLQLSSAVEVALTFAQTTRRAERERRMTAVIQRIRETLDIPTILRTAAEEIRGSLLVGSDERVESGRQTEVVVRLSSQGQPVPTSMVSENEDKVK